MNLISGVHHSCERREHAFIVLREYIIISLSFVSIRYYLLYDLQVYILCIMLNYKNLQFKKFIDDIAIGL